LPKGQGTSYLDFGLLDLAGYRTALFKADRKSDILDEPNPTTHARSGTEK
jgi:hypothetical protein